MKTALVTGANRGIGHEIVRQLALRDFRVWLSGRNEEAVRKAVSMLKKQDLSVEPVSIDVADGESVREAFRALAGQIERLDVLATTRRFRWTNQRVF